MLKKWICTLLAAALLATPAFALTPPDIQAKAYILYEKSSGETLQESNADEQLYPASTTKLLTAALAMEYGNPDDVVTVPKEATEGLFEQGSSVYLIPGEEIGFMDLMRYLLIASGNDAANTLAIHISGSIDAFVTLMNNKVQELGCENSHFTNPNGLPDENHYTSARDLLKIALYAMQNETIAQLVTETSVTLPVTNKHTKTTTKYSTNYMLPGNHANPTYGYEGCLGIKTGSTTAAGLCFISAVQKDDLTFYTVVLGASKGDDGTMGSFTETKKLFDFAKNNYANQVMLKNSEPICTVPVRLAANKQDTILLTPEDSVTALLPTDFQTSDLQLDYTAPESVDAPVEEGQVLGELTVSYQGREYAKMNLVSSSAVERSEPLYIIDRITGFFGGTAFKIILAAVAAFLLILVVYVIVFNRRRRKKHRSRGRHI
ncbi:MAG: D-alanyl-D-alanine carboxypeptidase family protein [Clostridiaceae bacterium]|nr:D-alanyl-D-alanine carboxypeptidase family protein [Clostridiaceae bacterium]